MTTPQDTAGRTAHKAIAREYRMLASKCGDPDDAADLRGYADMHERASLIGILEELRQRCEGEVCDGELLDRVDATLAASQDWRCEMSKLAHSNEQTMAAIEAQDDVADCQYLSESMRKEICEACGREIEKITECYRIVCPYQDATFEADAKRAALSASRKGAA